MKKWLKKIDWFYVGIISYVVIMWLLYDAYWTNIYNN